jgi:DNA helicase II / ATP-dependent DNA helicase PcrA
VSQALMLLSGAAVTTAANEPLFKTVSDVLRSLGRTQEGPDVRGAVRDRWESLNALMGLAEEAPDGTSLRSFVDDLNERKSSQHDPTRNAVTLSTIHAAKGLEWRSVYLAGLSEGLLPISYARTDEAIEEERRLLYVGVTRARETLTLSWSAQQNRVASRFLADLQR